MSSARYLFVRTAALAALAGCSEGPPDPAESEPEPATSSVAQSITSYPSCSACTTSSTCTDVCWPSGSTLLSTCGESGSCALSNLLHSPSAGAALTGYINAYHLSGCAAMAPLNGYSARECTNATVVYNSTLQRAFALPKTTAGSANLIRSKWLSNSTVGGTSYLVSHELGAPTSDARILNTGNATNNLVQMFARGGIALQSTFDTGAPRASWVGGLTNSWMAALGARWLKNPMSLDGDMSGSAGIAFSVTGAYGAAWPATLFASSSTAYEIGGADDVDAAIRAKFAAGGNNPLGLPTGDAQRGAQTFANAIVAVDHQVKAHFLAPQAMPVAQRSALWSAWSAEPASIRPAADTTYNAADGGGWRVDTDDEGPMARTFAVRTGDTTAYEVGGDIRVYWLAHGAQSGYLGWPVASQTAVGTTGAFQAFTKGVVYRSPDGTFGVEGGTLSPILAYYVQHGGPTGAYGWPVEDAPNAGTNNYVARMQGFAHGSILAVNSMNATGNIFGVEAANHVGYQLPQVTNKVTLDWTASDDFDTHTYVYRSINNAPYVKIASYGHLGVGTFHFVDDATTDPTPPPDSQQIRYYIARTDDYSTASSIVLNYFHEARLAVGSDWMYHSIARAQLRIDVDSAAGAGTDGGLHVTTNNGVPGTWVDSPYDDFEAGTSKVYDLLVADPDDLTKRLFDVTDVKYLQIYDPSNDDVCISRVQLLLNNCDGDEWRHVVFEKTFSPCHDLTQGAMVIDTTELRAYNGGDNVFTGQDMPTCAGLGIENVPAPENLPGIISLTDALFGHKLHEYQSNAWFREGNETTFQWIDDTTIHVTTHLRLESDLGYWSVDSNLNFDMQLVNHLFGTEVVVSNVDLGLSLPLDALNSLMTTLLNSLSSFAVDVFADPGGSYAVIPNQGFDLCFLHDGTIFVCSL